MNLDTTDKECLVLLQNQRRNRIFNAWREKAIAQLPELSKRIFALRKVGYMGCGFHWGLEKSLGHSMFVLQNFDTYPRDYGTRITMQVNFEYLFKKVRKAEKSAEQLKEQKNV